MPRGNDDQLFDTVIIGGGINGCGRVLESRFTKAFEYSDCWVEDSRLVALNARYAAYLHLVGFSFP